MIIYTVVPMAWMILTSLKGGFAAMMFPPQWWPAEPTLANYTRLLDPNDTIGRDFLRYFWNSLWVSTTTTILAVIVAVPAAYAFSRFRFPGRTFLFFAVLLRNMFPAVIFLVPLFILMRVLGPREHPRLADPDLPDLRPAARHLAAQGVLRQHPDPARAGGADRRRDALPGLLPDRHAALDAGHHRHRDLQLHRRVERVHLRLHVPHQERPDDAAGRHPALLRREHHRLARA